MEISYNVTEIAITKITNDLELICDGRHISKLIYC